MAVEVRAQVFVGLINIRRSPYNATMHRSQRKIRLIDCEMNWPATPCVWLRRHRWSNKRQLRCPPQRNRRVLLNHHLMPKYVPHNLRSKRLGMSVPVDDGVDCKDKMSRALGAAYLGHQVAKLESRINNTDPSAYSPANSPRGGGRGRGPRGGGRVWTPERSGQRSRRRSFTLHPVAAEAGSEPPQASTPSSGQAAPVPKEKPIMANVIVLDASVLVHALGQVKRWCKEERKETLIVPLEGASRQIILHTWLIHNVV